MEVFHAVSALASQSQKNDGAKEGIVESYNNAIAMMSEGEDEYADEDEDADDDEGEDADDETNDDDSTTLA